MWGGKAISIPDLEINLYCIHIKSKLIVHHTHRNENNNCMYVYRRRRNKKKLHTDQHAYNKNNISGIMSICSSPFVRLHTENPALSLITIVTSLYL